MSKKEPKLTPAQEETRKAFIDLKAKARAAQIALGELGSLHRKQGGCVAGRFGDSTNCLICGDDLGWWCPESKNGLCEYNRKNGEYCVHCGEPSERK